MRDWETPARAPPRRRRWILAVGLLIAGLGTAVASAPGHGPRGPGNGSLTIEEGAEPPSAPPNVQQAPTDVPDAGADGTTLEAAEGRPAGEWRTIAAGPLAPGGVAGSAWTGDELVIWTLRDLQGAAYDPDRDTWRDVADAPTGSAAGAGWAWTGEEVLLVGPTEGSTGSQRGGEAFAYDPATDEWRALAPPPAGAWRWETAVWSDGQLVMLGARSADSDGEARPAAIAYEPGADEWRALPRPPVWSRTGRVQTAALGGQVMVVGHHRTGTGDDARRAITAYDPQAREWADPQPVPSDGLWSVGIAPVPAEGHVAMVGAVQSTTWEDVTATWSPEAGLEWDALPRRRVWGQHPPHLEWTSHGLLLWAPGAKHRWLLDDDQRRWRPLAAAPLGAREGMAVAWTGDELIVWGGRGSEGGLRDDGAAWRP